MTTGDDTRASFYALTPEVVLDAVERTGRRCTGRCFALNSLENRVYDVELEGGARVVAKFYRPGRWSRDAIADEHRLLCALDDAEIPVCPPLVLDDGDTLGRTPDGVWFAVFPRVGGRSPDELSEQDLGELGRLLGRIHNVADSVEVVDRPALSPSSYGDDCVAVILERGELAAGLAPRYQALAGEVCALGHRMFDGIATQLIHADCHRGNLLRNGRGWMFLDFDDSAHGPAVQDLWLLLPARAADCPREVDALVAGYETFRPFEWATLHLVELLRALRYIRYAAWVAERWSDPAFPRAFPGWGTDRYWQEQIADLSEQLELLAGGSPGR